MTENTAPTTPDSVDTSCRVGRKGSRLGQRRLSTHARRLPSPARQAVTWLRRPRKSGRFPKGSQPVARGRASNERHPWISIKKSTHPGGGAGPSERNAKLTHRVVALVSSAGTGGREDYPDGGVWKFALMSWRTERDSDSKADPNGTKIRAVWDSRTGCPSRTGIASQGRV
jgi:hypothetical protein